MKNLLLNLTFTAILLSVGYSQCNESNWEEYYPNMEGCDLAYAYLPGANLSEANLSGACLEGAIGFTQTNYYGTPILEGCASGGGDCSFEDTDEDGYDDSSYDAGFDIGALSGDSNGDGVLNVLDLVYFVEIIVNGD